MAEQQLPEAVAFYSRAPGLTISAIKPTVHDVAGVKTWLGEKLIQFQQLGQSSYGCFMTKDPELVRFLNKRREEHIAQGQVPDVLTKDEYVESIKPPEVTIAELRQRLLLSESKMSEVLQSQGKMAKTS